MKRKKGVTLIELVVEIVVVGIIAFLIGMILFEAFNVSSRSKELVAISTNARQALTRMAREIMEAVAINNLPFTDQEEVSFTYDFNNDGTFDFCRYYLSGDKIIMETSTSPAYLTLASGIKELKFTASTFSSPTYGVEVIINLKAKENKKDIEFRTKVVPRIGRI